MEQYQKRHQGKKPAKIVVNPPAALALAAVKNLTPILDGIPVEIVDFLSEDVVTDGPALGVFLQQRGDELALRGCDLAMNKPNVV